MFHDGKILGSSLIVKEAAHEFEVGVGEQAMGVGRASEVFGEGGRKRQLPEQGLGRRWVGSQVEMRGGEPDLACAKVGGIVAPKEGGSAGNEFSEAGGVGG